MGHQQAYLPVAQLGKPVFLDRNDTAELVFSVGEDAHGRFRLSDLLVDGDQGLDADRRARREFKLLQIVGNGKWEMGKYILSF